MRGIRKLSLFLIVVGFSNALWAASCNGELKATGFSTVKAIPGGKSYFFREPHMCDAQKSCNWKRKAYLVPENFVQTAQIQNGFVCAVFRNFDGWGGKETVGWLPLADLAPIRATLEQADLLGSWVQIPCSAGDDCIIDITQSEKKELQISVISHLHSRPGISFDVSAVKQEKGKLVLSAVIPGEDETKTMELVYDSKDLEPGTISLSGEDFFAGVYRR